MSDEQNWLKDDRLLKGRIIQIEDQLNMLKKEEMDFSHFVQYKTGEAKEPLSHYIGSTSDFLPITTIDLVTPKYTTNSKTENLNWKE